MEALTNPGLGSRIVVCHLGPTALKAGQLVEWLEAYAGDRPVLVLTPVPGQADDRPHAIDVIDVVVPLGQKVLLLTPVDRAQYVALFEGESGPRSN
jgi:hypothetical protein